MIYAKLTKVCKSCNNKRIYYLGILIEMILYPNAGWTTNKKEIIKLIIKGGKWHE